MADETDDWLSAAAEEPPPPAPTPKAAAKPPPGKKASVADSSSIAPETEVTGGPKKKLNNHWARPIFLQYNYMYNYYHNYYDDYIEYLDRRMRGIEPPEKPRPQTWAERALRTYTRNYYPHSTTYSTSNYQYKSERRSDTLVRTAHQQSFYSCFDRSLKPLYRKNQ
uniref:Flightin n=1 Tax=Lygus hesperus TaxID=30085 RepID=A0A0K8T1N9_LYGHE